MRNIPQKVLSRKPLLDVNFSFASVYTEFLPVFLVVTVSEPTFSAFISARYLRQEVPGFTESIVMGRHCHIQLNMLTLGNHLIKNKNKKHYIFFNVHQFSFVSFHLGERAVVKFPNRDKYKKDVPLLTN